jgi:hypothetical protein
VPAIPPGKVTAANACEIGAEDIKGGSRHGIFIGDRINNDRRRIREGGRTERTIDPYRIEMYRTRRNAGRDLRIGGIHCPGGRRIAVADRESDLLYPYQVRSADVQYRARIIQGDGTDGRPRQVQRERIGHCPMIGHDPDHTGYAGISGSRLRRRRDSDDDIRVRRIDRVEIRLPYR